MGAEWLAPVSIGLPLLVAAVLIAAAPLVGDRTSNAIAIGTAFVTTLVCASLLQRSAAGLVVYWFGGWQPRDGFAVGVSLAIDPVGAGLAVLASVLVTASLLYSWWYFEAIGTLFHALMLVFLGAMVGFCLTGDLFNMFVFFELMSVAAYALTAYKIEEQAPIQGAINFAVSNSIGAFMILIGIALLYGRTGVLNLAQMGVSVSEQPADRLVAIAFGLICVGLLVKAAVVPLHFWLADAHAVAPTPVCVLFSGIMVELGVYGVMRVYWTVFSSTAAPHAAEFQSLFWVAGALTGVIGAFMCYLQRHIKRMLAYSTVSHVGAFVIGLAMLSSAGVAATMLYIVGHGLTKAALFMTSGILLHRHGSVDELELAGRARDLPAAGLVALVGGLGLAGLPPMLTALGKSLEEDSLPASVGGALVVVLVLSSAVTGGTVLRMWARVFTGLGAGAGDPSRSAPSTGEEHRESDKPPHVPGTMILVPLVLIGLTCVLAVIPTPLLNMQSATQRFVDQPAYASAVLEGQPELATPSGEAAHFTDSGIRSGIVATVLAVLIAAASLGAAPVPERTGKAASRLIEGIARPLRAAHSGHTGDYAAWLLVGAALFVAASLAVLR